MAVKPDHTWEMNLSYDQPTTLTYTIKGVPYWDEATQSWMPAVKVYRDGQLIEWEVYGQPMDIFQAVRWSAQAASDKAEQYKRRLSEFGEVEDDPPK